MSDRPEDATSFGPERAVAPSSIHTYPNPRYLAAEDRLYLLYRNANTHLACITSEDGGEIWGEERELVRTPGWREESSVYFKVGGDGESRVDVAATCCIHGGVANSYKDVRHLSVADRELSAADGESLAAFDDGSLPLAFPDVPAVYDSNGTWTDPWVWDCATHGGRPAVAYVDFQDFEESYYRYARWTGSAWADEKICDAGSHITPHALTYAGGVALDHDDPGVCYVSVGDADASNVERWERAGDGWTRTWRSDDATQNVRPVVPRNRRADLPVVWMRGDYDYFSHRRYDTGIVGPSRE